MNDGNDFIGVERIEKEHKQPFLQYWWYWTSALGSTDERSGRF
jgi:hypothetical protein